MSRRIFGGLSQALTSSRTAPSLFHPPPRPAALACNLFLNRLSSTSSGVSLESLPPNISFVNTTPQVLFAAKVSPPPAKALEVVKVLPVTALFPTLSPVGTVTLDNRVFGVKIRADLVHRVIRWQLANSRTTAYKTKGRDESRGGGRKPHPQKHTGKARAGSIRDAHWRGGNRAPAIVIRDWSLKLPRKVRRAGLRVALSSKYIDRRLFVISDPVVESLKTKSVLPVLESVPWSASALIVHGSGGVDPNFFLACRNFHKIRFVSQLGTNVYDIVKYENLVITETALAELTARLAPEA